MVRLGNRRATYKDPAARVTNRPFQSEPDFGVASVNYYFAELLARAGEPA